MSRRDRSTTPAQPVAARGEPDSIEVIARGIIIEHGHVLLCRNRKRGYCYLPGGHVEPGESAKAALVRELLEEAGVRITPGWLVALEDHLFTQRKRDRHELNAVFTATLAGKARTSSPRPIQSHEEAIDFVWTPLRSLRRSRLMPASHIPIIRDVARTSPLVLAMADRYDVAREGRGARTGSRRGWRYRLSINV